VIIDSVFYFGDNEATPGFRSPFWCVQLENLPEHKLGSQQLNCCAVRRERNYTEKLLADSLHCSWCLLLN
jgi:hypothetical protein